MLRNGEKHLKRDPASAWDLVSIPKKKAAIKLLATTYGWFVPDAAAVTPACAGLKPWCTGFALAAGAAELVYTVYTAVEGSDMASLLMALPAAAGIVMQVTDLAKGLAGNASAGQSCMSALMLAIQAGLRYATMNNLKGVANRACGEVNKLTGSDSQAAGGAGLGGTQPTGSANLSFGGGTSSGGSGTTGGGATGGGGKSTDKLADFDACTQNGGSFESCAHQVNSAALAGRDGNGFRQAGGVPRLPGQPSLSELRELAKSGGAGAAIAAAMPEAGGAFGQGLSKLADEATKNADKINAALGYSDVSTAVATVGGFGNSNAASGGGGGGATNPFANLFGGGQAKTGTTATGGLKFGGIPQAPVIDIYHTGSPLSIFEIVSGRIDGVKGRVESPKQQVIKRK